MWNKLAAHENPWVEADNIVRLKTAATALLFGLALLTGITTLVVGLLQT